MSLQVSDRYHKLDKFHTKSIRSEITPLLNRSIRSEKIAVTD